MKEIWKVIDGYEGRYEVSNLGRFRGPNGVQNGRIFPNGFRYVSVNMPAKQMYILLHRLVAKHFCPCPEGCNAVDHLDGNISNDAASNLKWVPSSEDYRVFNENNIDNGRLAAYGKPRIIIRKGDFSKVVSSKVAASRYTRLRLIDIDKLLKHQVNEVSGWTCEFEN